VLINKEKKNGKICTAENLREEEIWYMQEIP